MVADCQGNVGSCDKKKEKKSCLQFFFCYSIETELSLCLVMFTSRPDEFIGPKGFKICYGLQSDNPNTESATAAFA